MRSFGVLQSNSAQGLWGFDSTPTNSGATGVGGNAFASFLLGYPTDVRRLYTPGMPHYHSNEPSVFFQDDWRAKSWLTINLGIRYDVFTPLTEEDNHLSNFVPADGKLLVAGEDGVGRTAGVNTDYSDIGPRVGFSATLPSQMVLRGGWGLAYYPNNKNAGAFMKNPPFTANYGPNTSTAASGGVPNMFLKDGLPAVVFANPDQPTGNVIGTDVNFKSDRAQQFNLMLEKEFSGNVVTVGYVGSRGDRLQLGVAMNYNLAPAGAGGGAITAAVLLSVPADGQCEHPVEPRQVDVQRLAAHVQPPLPRRPDDDLSLHMGALPAVHAGAVGLQPVRVGRHAAVRRPAPLCGDREL